MFRHCLVRGIALFEGLYQALLARTRDEEVHDGS